MEEIEEFNNNCLCYGDIIYLEVSGVEGCERGGLLGTEDFKSATNRNLRVAYEKSNYGVQGKAPNNKKLFGVSPIIEKGSLVYPPSNFFINNLFMIVPGVGFEAAGEPVLYGTQIKLSMSSTGEMIRANPSTKELDLVTKSEYEKLQQKDFHFQIKPKYDIRSEGDFVQHNDLISLMDHIGQDVSCIHANKVILSFHPEFRIPGFRISIFLKYEHVLKHKIMKGGDVIQLYHRVGSSFLMATRNTEDEHTTPNPSSTLSLSHVQPYIHNSIILDHADTFWQLETIPFGGDHLKVNGRITEGTKFRLRHLLTDQYLAIVNNKVLLSDTFHDDSLFEYHVKYDALQDTKNSTNDNSIGVYNSLALNDNLEIPFGCSVRLFNQHSASYMILSIDHRAMNHIFSSSVTDYEKDIFQTISIPSIYLDVILYCKNLQSLLSHIVDRLRYSKHLTHLEREKLLLFTYQILIPYAHLLHQHMPQIHNTDEEGTTNEPSSSHASSSTEQTTNATLSQFYYSVSEQLEILSLLIQTIQLTTQRGLTHMQTNPMLNEHAGKLLFHDYELDLTKQVYYIIGLLVSYYPQSLKTIISHAAISMMVSHYSCFISQLDWLPPILPILECYHLHHAEVFRHENNTTSIEQVNHHQHLKDKYTNMTGYGASKKNSQEKSKEDGINGTLQTSSSSMEAASSPEAAFQAIPGHMLASGHSNSFVLLTDDDIQQLLQCIVDQFTAQDVPASYPLMVLCKACHNDIQKVSMITNTNHIGHINSVMQLKICSMLFGNIFAINLSSQLIPPAYSIFFYRTVMEEIPYKSSTRNSATADDMQDEGEAADKPPVNENYDKTFARSFLGRHKLYISTNILGQVAQHGKDRQYMKPKDSFARKIAPEDPLLVLQSAHEAEWEQTMNYRNHFLSPHIYCKSFPNSLEVPTPPTHIAESLNILLENHNWKELSNLKRTELSYYASSVQLLAAMTAGRNYWTQRIVRQVIPLDHILYMLDYLKVIPTSADMSFRQSKRFTNKKTAGGKEKPTHSHGYRKASDIADIEPFIRLKNNLLYLLFTCYLDHMYLPPIPMSGTELLTNPYYRIHHEQFVPKSWDDMFYQEACFKLFGLFTQIDHPDVLFHGSSKVGSMNITQKTETIEEFLSYVEQSCTYFEVYQIAVQKCQYNNRELANKDFKEIIDMIRSAVKTEPSLLISEDFRVSSIMQKQKLWYYQQSIHSLEQRALLLKIILTFLNEEAFDIWLEKLQYPLLTCIRQSHFHSSASSGANYASQKRFSLDPKYLTGLSSPNLFDESESQPNALPMTRAELITVVDHNSKIWKRGVDIQADDFDRSSSSESDDDEGDFFAGLNNLFKKKADNKDETSDDEEHKENNRETPSTRKHRQQKYEAALERNERDEFVVYSLHHMMNDYSTYMNNMFAVVRVLMLYGFFEPSYNMNPIVFTQSIPEYVKATISMDTNPPKLQYFYPTYDSISFSYQYIPIKSNQDENIPVLYCIEMTKKQQKHKSNYSDSPKTNEEFKKKAHPSINVKDRGHLYFIRTIMNCILRIISVWPGKLLHSKYQISDSPPLIHDFFQRQFGFPSNFSSNNFTNGEKSEITTRGVNLMSYKRGAWKYQLDKDGFWTDEEMLEFQKQLSMTLPSEHELVHHLIDNKLIGCKILSICLDIIERSSVKSLQDIFSSICTNALYQKQIKVFAKLLQGTTPNTPAEKDADDHEHLPTLKVSARRKSVLTRLTSASAASLKPITRTSSLSNNIELAAKLLLKRLSKNQKGLFPEEVTEFRQKVFSEVGTTLGKHPDMYWNITEFVAEQTFHNLFHMLHYHSSSLHTEVLYLIYRMNIQKVEMNQLLMTELTIPYEEEENRMYQYLYHYKYYLTIVLGQLTQYYQTFHAVGQGIGDNIIDWLLKQFRQLLLLNNGSSASDADGKKTLGLITFCYIDSFEHQRVLYAQMPSHARPKNANLAKTSTSSAAPNTPTKVLPGSGLMRKHASTLAVVEEGNTTNRSNDSEHIPNTLSDSNKLSIDTNSINVLPEDGQATKNSAIITSGSGGNEGSASETGHTFGNLMYSEITLDTKWNELYQLLPNKFSQEKLIQLQFPQMIIFFMIHNLASLLPKQLIQYFSTINTPTPSQYSNTRKNRSNRSNRSSRASSVNSSTNKSIRRLEDLLEEEQIASMEDSSDQNLLDANAEFLSHEDLVQKYFFSSTLPDFPDKSVDKRSLEKSMYEMFDYCLMFLYSTIYRNRDESLVALLSADLVHLLLSLSYLFPQAIDILLLCLQYQPRIMNLYVQDVHFLSMLVQLKMCFHGLINHNLTFPVDSNQPASEEPDLQDEELPADPAVEVSEEGQKIEHVEISSDNLAVQLDTPMIPSDHVHVTAEGINNNAAVNGSNHKQPRKESKPPIKKGTKSNSSNTISLVKVHKLILLVQQIVIANIQYSSNIHRMKQYIDFLHSNITIAKFFEEGGNVNKLPSYTTEATLVSSSSATLLSPIIIQGNNSSNANNMGDINLQSGANISVPDNTQKKKSLTVLQIILSFGLSELYNFSGDIGQFQKQLKAHQSVATFFESICSRITFYSPRYLCYRFDHYTNRHTFPRLPKDVLLDPLLNATFYRRLKRMLPKWARLSDETDLGIHLRMLTVLGQLCPYSIPLRQSLQQAFATTHTTNASNSSADTTNSSQNNMMDNNISAQSLTSPNLMHNTGGNWYDSSNSTGTSNSSVATTPLALLSLLEVLMIDKYEIRIAYLTLLTGIWFTPQVTNTVFSVSSTDGSNMSSNNANGANDNSQKADANSKSGSTGPNTVSSNSNTAPTLNYKHAITLPPIFFQYEYIPYYAAFLTQCAQDLRLYLFVIKDDEVILPSSLPTATTTPYSTVINSNAVPSQGGNKIPTSIWLLWKQMELVEDFVGVMIPFLISFLSSNLYDYLSSISQSQLQSLRSSKVFQSILLGNGTSDGVQTPTNKGNKNSKSHVRFMERIDAEKNISSDNPPGSTIPTIPHITDQMISISELLAEILLQSPDRLLKKANLSEHIRTFLRAIYDSCNPSSVVNQKPLGNRPSQSALAFTKHALNYLDKSNKLLRAFTFTPTKPLPPLYSGNTLQTTMKEMTKDWVSTNAGGTTNDSNASAARDTSSMLAPAPGQSSIGASLDLSKQLSKWMSKIMPEEVLKNYRRLYLMEFISEVNHYMSANGNQHAKYDHYLKTSNPQRIFIGDKQYNVSSKEYSLIANTIEQSRFDIISNPFNCESFAFMEKEIAKLIINFVRYRDPIRFESLLSAIDSIPFNQETQLKDLYQPKFDLLEDDFITNTASVEDSYNGEGNISSKLPAFAEQEEVKRVSVVQSINNSVTSLVRVAGRSITGYYCSAKRIQIIQQAAEERQQYIALSKYSHNQFGKWCKHGGLQLQHIFQHMLFSLKCYQQAPVPTLPTFLLGNIGIAPTHQTISRHAIVTMQPSALQYTSVTCEDMCVCNYYWNNVITKGLLRNRVDELFEKYDEQKEIQLLQIQNEIQRLYLIQDVLEGIGAVDLVVKQLSLSVNALSKYLSKSSIRLIHMMAIDLGTAIHENGNRTTQSATIDRIQTEYQLAVSMGRTEHFVFVIRSMFQTFSQMFLTNRKAIKSTAVEVVKLLSFLSLLCEGHYAKAQLYLGTTKIVAEVAGFITDVNSLLAAEMKKSFFTEEELPTKFRPKVLGTARNLIRFVTPTIPMFNGTAGEERKQASRLEEHKFIDLQYLSCLVEVITAGLEALSEFCQGPRSEIQLIIARAGTTKQFQTFFEFFGAFQLVSKYKNPLKSFGKGYHGTALETVSTKKEIRELYEEDVIYHVTHETMLPLPQSGKLYWIGNDPLALSYILADIDESQTSSSQVGGNAHGSSSTHPLLLKATRNQSKSTSTGTTTSTNVPVNRASQYVSKLSNSCYHMFCEYPLSFFPTFTIGATIDIMDLENEIKRSNQVRIPIGNKDAWCKEKHLYCEYRKRQAKLTASRISLESNYYAELMNFENILVQFEQSCVKLSLSLLEGSTVTNTESEKKKSGMSTNDLNDENEDISMIVMHNIGHENLVCNMANYWSRYLDFDSVLQDISSDDSFERRLSYSYYSLVMHIMDVQQQNVDGLSSMVNHWLEVSEIQINDHVGRIEVRGPESLVVAYFPKPSIVTKYWNRGDIAEIRANIVYPSKLGTRDSVEEKVKNFLRDSEELIAMLRHLEILDQYYAPQNLCYYALVQIAHMYNTWSQLTFILTLTMNMLLLLSVELSPGYYAYDSSGPSFSFTGSHSVVRYDINASIYETLIYAIGLTHLISAGLTVYSYSVLYIWLYLKLDMKDNPENAFTFRGLFLSRLVFFLNRCYFLGTNTGQLVGNAITLHIWSITASIKYISERLSCLYYVALLTFSVLGNFVSPLFFSCCLIEVLRMSKMMQYVTKAFTVNIDQVFATLLLSAIILYLFTTLAFSNIFLLNQYTFGGLGGDCTSLQQCYRLHLDYGVLQSVSWNYPNQIETIGGELFNFSYVFIMQIVIPGLISGIIIDTFSEMRSYKQAVEEDVVNTCFVCNIDREDFESQNFPFEDHIKKDHNMWMYLWFWVYLDECDQTDFDGIEQFCYDVIQNGNEYSTRWLPLKMARCLSKVRDKYDLYTIFSKITTLQGTLDKLSSNLKTDFTAQEKLLRASVKGENGNLMKELQKVLEDLRVSTPTNTNTTDQHTGRGTGGSHLGGRSGKKKML